MITLLFLALLLASPVAARTLDVYVIDVERGKAMLIVAPSGQSMLIDAGYPGQGGRDTDRIIRTIQQAGVKQLDYVVVTHYDTDHVENVPPLVDRLTIPVLAFVDHGPPLFKRQEELDRV